MAGREDAVSVAEIAELAARLRALSAAGADGDRAERERFLADKAALLDRIAAETRDAPTAGRPGRGAAWVPADANPDGWVSDGYEAAHQAHLDALAHADAEPDPHAPPVDVAIPEWTRDEVRRDIGPAAAPRHARMGAGRGRGVEEESRREQLARWHHDEHQPDGRDTADGYGSDDAAGWER